MSITGPAQFPPVIQIGEKVGPRGFVAVWVWHPDTHTIINKATEKQKACFVVHKEAFNLQFVLPFFDVWGHGFQESPSH